MNLRVLLPDLNSVHRPLSARVGYLPARSLRALVCMPCRSPQLSRELPVLMVSCRVRLLIVCLWLCPCAPVFVLSRATCSFLRRDCREWRRFDFAHHCFRMRSTFSRLELSLLLGARVRSCLSMAGRQGMCLMVQAVPFT